MEFILSPGPVLRTCQTPSSPLLTCLLRTAPQGHSAGSVFMVIPSVGARGLCVLRFRIDGFGDSGPSAPDVTPTEEKACSAQESRGGSSTLKSLGLGAEGVFSE